MSAYFIVDHISSEEQKALWPAHFTDYTTLEIGDDLQEIPAGAEVVLFLSDQHILTLIPQAIAREWCLQVLPHPEAPQGQKGFMLTDKRDPLTELESKIVQIPLL